MGMPGGFEMLILGAFGLVVLGGGFAVIYALMGGFRSDKHED